MLFRSTTVLIPKENEKDLAEIPDNVKRGLEIVPVGHVDEVLSRALVTPVIPIEWKEEDETPVAKKDKNESGIVTTH